MRDGPAPLAAGSTTPVRDTEPWAVAINVSARVGDIDIALCSYIVDGDFARLTGLVRVGAPHDVRLVAVPMLTIVSPGIPPFEVTSAHLLPQGSRTWVSWFYPRPADGPRAYEARIDHIDLGFQIGNRAPLSIGGPWVFRFDIPRRPAASPLPT
ncbi:MAG: hypothetical protein ACYDCI_02310 [Candidatus Limnocylindrales bacterium]